jgi:hypothetical protein
MKQSSGSPLVTETVSLIEEETLPLVRFMRGVN